MSNPNTIREDIVLALGSEYDIVRELGRGGASVVYLARDRVLGRDVAIKVIRDSHTADAEALARFEREARTLASLQHPNIVMLYGAKPLPGGSLALIMQHGSWSTLKAVIREKGPLPTDAIQQVLRDLASALAYLHKNHVVHRDIKPENIFIEAETGRALISDFGIAKSGDARASVTLAGVVIGTPAYMSPEQIDGAELTGRSDLYSLGMVGYEMLTGMRPWDGESLFGVIYKQKTEKLPSLGVARPDAPERLRALIEKATEKAPEDRWASAQEMLQELSSGDRPAAPVAWAEPVVVIAPERGSPAEFPTLEIGAALAAEAFSDRDRMRRRKQRMMAAAVLILLFSGGAGALAFSGRDLQQGEMLNATNQVGGEEYLEDASLATPASSAPTDTQQVAMRAQILDSIAEEPEPEPEVEERRPPPRTAAAPSGRRATQPPTRQREPEPVDQEEEENTAVAYTSPPAILPELSVTQPSHAAPSAAPMRNMETRPAESTAAPRLRNREQVSQLLSDRYPTDLRTRGIGGTAILTVLVSPTGSVESSRVVTSSGNTRLDQAALAVAARMQFLHAAGASSQPVWVAVPLTFTP